MLHWAVVLAMVAQVGSYLGSGYLLKALVDLSGSKLSVWRGTMITLAESSFGQISPGCTGVKRTRQIHP